jgi:hypothetical protein
MPGTRRRDRRLAMPHGMVSRTKGPSSTTPTTVDGRSLAAQTTEAAVMLQLEAWEGAGRGQFEKLV